MDINKLIQKLGSVEKVYEFQDMLAAVADPTDNKGHGHNAYMLWSEIDTALMDIL
jgi:hypothetical protein